MGGKRTTTPAGGGIPPGVALDYQGRLERPHRMYRPERQNEAYNETLEVLSHLSTRDAALPLKILREVMGYPLQASLKPPLDELRETFEVRVSNQGTRLGRVAWVPQAFWKKAQAAVAGYLLRLEAARIPE